MRLHRDRNPQFILGWLSAKRDKPYSICQNERVRAGGLPRLRGEFGAVEGEGLKFVVSEIKYLLRRAFWRILEGTLRSILRYLGFRLGRAERLIPLKI